MFVVTWGFNPEDGPSLALLGHLRNAGSKLIWFDGNRPAALRAFRKRSTVSEELGSLGSDFPSQNND